MVVATFNLFSIHPDITTKVPDGPSTAVPLSAAAGPARLALTPPAVAPWFPSPGHGTDELQQRYPKSGTGACFRLYFLKHHITSNGLTPVLNYGVYIFWILYFFTSISLLFALFFLRFWRIFVLGGCLFGQFISFSLLLKIASLSTLQEPHSRPLNMPTIS